MNDRPVLPELMFLLACPLWIVKTRSSSQCSPSPRSSVRASLPTSSLPIDASWRSGGGTGHGRGPNAAHHGRDSTTPVDPKVHGVSFSFLPPSLRPSLSPSLCPSSPSLPPSHPTSHTLSSPHAPGSVVFVVVRAASGVAGLREHGVSAVCVPVVVAFPVDVAPSSPRPRVLSGPALVPGPRASQTTSSAPTTWRRWRASWWRRRS